MLKMNPLETDLKRANHFFKQGRFPSAEKWYLNALSNCDDAYLCEQIIFNLSFTKKRQGESLKNIDREKLISLKKNKQKILEKINKKLKNSQIQKNSITINDNLKKKKDIYEALNDDPNFLLRLEKSIEKGFHIIKFKINLRSNKKKFNARLYIDYGQGFNEKETVDLLGQNGKEITKILKFEKTIKAIRFDPIDHKDSFTLEEFNIASLPDSLAEDLMLISLMDEKGIIPNTKKDIKKIYLDYESIYSAENNNIDYNEWIENVEKPNSPTKHEVSKHLESFKHLPFFSIIMSITNKNEENLRSCLNSVINQSYPNWEFCIVNSCFNNTNIDNILDEYAKKDTRIKLKRSPENINISETMNLAFQFSTGDFIALISQLDQLAYHSLYFIALEIKKHPNGHFFYSDEDQINSDGIRHSPHFKSDWNPDLFYSQNYISNLAVYKADVIKKVGGFHSDFEAGQDYDLLLRSLSYIDGSQIHHIPRILYHRRKNENTDHIDSNENKEIEKSELKALRNHFKTNSINDITVEAGMVSNSYKVNWPIPTPAPKVSLLMPTRDQKEITEVAVRSILKKTTYSNFEIVILDNGSTNPNTLEFFSRIQIEDERVSVISYNHPFNYSAINNFGVANTKSELVGLINNDIEVINSDWLTEMVRQAIRPEIGCVGAKLYYHNDTIQHGGVVLGIGGVASHSHKNFSSNSDGYFNRLQLVQNYSAVTAACLIIKRKLYEKVNGLDEKNLRVAYNDIDFCLRIKTLGLRNIWTPYAKLYHYESISRGADDINPEKLERLKNESQYMLHKWGHILDNDDCYNNNLTKKSDDFSFNTSFSKPLDFSNNIYFSWNKSHNNSIKKRYACIFVGFDKNSQLHDYVIYYLKSLAKYFDIHYITTAEKLHTNQENISVLKTICKSITVRKNEGYDFGSWKFGIQEYYEDIINYDGLLLANDSVYGPIFDLTHFIDTVERSKCDVMAMTDSNEIDFHLQSYFVFYKQHVVKSTIFKKFWDNVSIQGDKWDIIKRYEIGLSQRLLRLGNFTIAPYCNMTGYPKINHTHRHWKDLIIKHKFPFIKIELVTKNPTSSDISDLRKVVEENSNYDLSLINKHIKAHALSLHI